MIALASELCHATKYRTHRLLQNARLVWSKAKYGQWSQIIVVYTVMITTNIFQKMIGLVNDANQQELN